MAEFIPIVSITDVSEATSVVELICAISGEVRLRELKVDEHLIRDSYIEFIRTSEADWDDVDYLTQESEACLTRAVDYLVHEISAELRSRAEAIGAQYPLCLREIDDEVVRLRATGDSMCVAYFWLIWIKLEQTGKNYLQYSKREGQEGGTEKDRLMSNFYLVFEYISVIAAAGFYDGSAWITAKCRSPKDVLAILKKVAKAVGNGQVKRLAQLRKNQKTTNDGRVDGIIVTRKRGAITKSSQIYLLQATAMKSDLKQKVVTQETIRFFDDFFVKKIRQAKHGILAVPHQYDDLVADECGSANCIYFDHDDLLQSLSFFRNYPENKALIDEFRRQCLLPWEYCKFS